MHQVFNEKYAEYKSILQKAADLNYAAAVLGWDLEVNMPPKGAILRGKQLATLSSMAHEMLTGERIGELLNELSELCQEGFGTPEEKANVRLSLYDYQKSKKLPTSFIEELSVLTSEGFNKWMEARNKNDFSIFLPVLKKMVALKRRQANLYGYESHPYDALLNEYERGATVAMIEPVFNVLKRELGLLLVAIKTVPQIDNGCLYKTFEKQMQWDFSIKILQTMGFDFEAGRQDYSEHPFTTSFSNNDVRITTRVSEHNFASLLWSSIHEGGHGLYEQGLPEEQYGLPLGEAASLSVHESQSRIWENCIGRGIYFWKSFYPQLQSLFPDSLAETGLRDFYKSCNRVEPSLIRTEADELTYHFHVLIRFELEKALIEGSLDVENVLEAWNEKYKQYLGVTPPDDKSSVLQDVHWSHGMFGYFPTYTLGSLYAVQYYEKAATEIDNFKTKLASGDFKEFLAWLRQKIHRYGRQFTSEELCVAITGSKLDPMKFIHYATEKYYDIYGIEHKS